MAEHPRSLETVPGLALTAPCHEKPRRAEQTGTVIKFLAVLERRGRGKGGLAWLGRAASPSSGRARAQALKPPPQRWLDLGGAQQGHLESRADYVGGRALGPGAVALIISSAYVSNGARLLQYLLNNQPRNSIVQDKK